MISRAGKENFFAAHYDWLVAGVGALALVGGIAFFAMTLGDDAEELASAEAARVERMQPAETGVKALDMGDYQNATRVTKSPVLVAEVSERKESFLASERRVKCKCGKVISGDTKKYPKCPFCGEKQEVDQMLVLDSDNDGMSDEWEKDNGFNPADPKDGALDTDGDGFTNVEEFLAKTNPRDAKDHPNYLDSLSVQLPLKETCVPFAFRKAMQVPGGWRCEFFDPAKKDAKRGMTGIVTAKVGEEVKGYDYVLKSYEKKTDKREKPGMKGMKVTVDVSEAVVERKADGKLVTLVIAHGKNPALTPVDVQATLVYERGRTQTIDVVPGSDLVLNGMKYKVETVKPVGKGAEVTVLDVASGEKRIIKAP